MTDEERKLIEDEVRENTEETFSHFKRYKRDLVLNNFIAYLIIQKYYDCEMAKFDDYETIFDEYYTIELVSEILQSISISLKDRFLKEYKKGNIIFLDKEENSYSYTCVEDSIKCKIVRYNNIIDAISCVHEFFHLLHLEKYDNNLSNEDYHYFTEILGLVGDLYSIYYLAFIKKDNLKEVKTYCFSLLDEIIVSAQETFVVGTIIDIYNKYHSLSESAVNNYLKSCEPFEEDIDLLEVYSCLGDMNYFDSVRYVYGIVVALQIASDLISGNKEKYKDIFNKFENMTPEEILKELSLDGHITSKEKLIECVDKIYENFMDIFALNIKENIKQNEKRTEK